MWLFNVFFVYFPGYEARYCVFWNRSTSTLVRNCSAARNSLSLSCSLTFLAIIIFLKLRAQQTRQLDCARAKPTEQTTKSLGLEIMGRLVGRAPVPVQSGRRLRARRRNKEARQTIYAAVVWGSVRRADSGESSEVNLEVNLGSILWEFVFWLRMFFGWGDAENFEYWDFGQPRRGGKILLTCQKHIFNEVFKKKTDPCQVSETRWPFSHFLPTAKNSRPPHTVTHLNWTSIPAFFSCLLTQRRRHTYTLEIDEQFERTREKTRNLWPCVCMHHPAFIIIIKISDQSVRANVFLSTTPFSLFLHSTLLLHLYLSFLLFLPARIALRPVYVCACSLPWIRCPEFVSLHACFILQRSTRFFLSSVFFF